MFGSSSTMTSLKSQKPRSRRDFGERIVLSPARHWLCTRSRDMEGANFSQNARHIARPTAAECYCYLAERRWQHCSGNLEASTHAKSRFLIIQGQFTNIWTCNDIEIVRGKRTWAPDSLAAAPFRFSIECLLAPARVNWPLPLVIRCWSPRCTASKKDGGAEIHEDLSPPLGARPPE